MNIPNDIMKMHLTFTPTATLLLLIGENGDFYGTNKEINNLISNASKEIINRGSNTYKEYIFGYEA